MTNKYVSFISDEDFIKCVATLHKSYLKAKKNLTKNHFYSNKVDSIKLLFDSKFNSIDEERLINTEILRQIDKSINNSIGTFHEQILGAITGFEQGNLSGFDIRALDNTLFADIKNKHNTMNSSAAESLFQKLKNYADTYKDSKCYWVQVLARSSFNELWKGDINGKEYAHSRVYKISGDQFYALLSGQHDALCQIYTALPVVIKDYLSTLEEVDYFIEHSALAEIKAITKNSNRSILEQITFDNYSYYFGFDKI